MFLVSIKGKVTYADVEDIAIEDITKEWLYKAPRRLERFQKAQEAAAQAVQGRRGNLAIDE